MRSPTVLEFIMYQIIVMLFLLAAYTASVSGVPSPAKILASKGFTTEELHPSTWEFNVRINEDSVRTGQAVLIPWQCFAKQKEQMCSCTIVSQDYVLARSSCIRNGTTGKVQVHAGALNSSNANQIVGASLLATSEPPPEGVVALKLDVQLSFNDYVSKISLIDYRDDVRQGLVRGFGYNKANGSGAFESKYCWADVYQAECPSGRLCAVPADCGLTQSTDDQSTTRDFLDLYDDLDDKIYFLGVLETRLGENVAMYYNVKHMRQWIMEYLPGVISD